MRSSPARLLASLLLGAPALATLGGCGLVGAVADAPGKVLNGGSTSEALPPSLLQAGVMRFADTFAALITSASRDFAQRAGTTEARIQGMTWAVGQNTAAFTIASGANPTANLLDMIVLTTLGRTIHEQYWSPKVWGEADRPMLEAYQALERDIWKVAEEVLAPQQQEAVRTALREWSEEHPEVVTTAFVRLPTFQDMFESKGKKGEKTSMLGEVGSLLTLDPLQGLEPTLRQIEQTRLFAERALFYSQRIPLVFQLQTELLVLKLTQVPEVQSALADTTRITDAANSIAATAAGLPEAVRVEREAAVRQISEELTQQREGLVSDLERAQAPTRAILGEARTTLEAGARMSDALEAALRQLDAFVGRFTKGPEDETSAAPVAAVPADEPPAAPAADAPPRKPFDIADYGTAATNIGEAADRLAKLVTTLDQSLPEAQRLIDEVAARGERTIDHAFQRGLVLGGALVVLAALATLVVRRVSARWSAPPTSS